MEAHEHRQDPGENRRRIEHLAKYRAWGHEYVITSLLENVVILETIKKRGEPPLEATFTYPHPRPHAMSVWEAP